MKMKMLCRLLLGALALAGSARGQEITVPVTFSVDMGVQIAAANFDPATQSVLVRGGFNGWGEGSTLVREGVTTIYSGTFSVTGSEGGAVEYKFYKTGVGDAGWETSADRSFNLSSASPTQVLATVYFNNQTPADTTVDVTFSVDMGVQIAALNFDPATMGVVVRGDFNAWGMGSILTRVGETTVYSGTFSVTGTEGGAVGYKFFGTPDPGGLLWETMVDNRTFNLGAAGTTQVLATVYFNNQGPADATVSVTFSVDMSVQIAALTFDPSTMGVEVRGEFNAWGGGSTLAREGETTIYSGTFSVTGTAGGAVSYKFFGLPDPGGLEYETIDNRSFNLGANGTTQVLATVYFNNQGPAVAVSVTFSVDMGVQIAAMNFDPAIMGVEVRGDFNAWAGGSVLAREGETSIYSGTFSVTGSEGGAIGYKFFGTPDPGGLGYETNDNRSFNLGAAGTTQVLATVYFNNQGPVEPEQPSIGPITFVVGTGAFSFEVPTGFTLSKVQGAGTAVVAGDLVWTDLEENTDYTLTAGVVTILTKADGAPAQHLIRIWVTAMPT